jgi:hypothetical protein
VADQTKRSPGPNAPSGGTHGCLRAEACTAPCRAYPRARHYCSGVSARAGHPESSVPLKVLKAVGRHFSVPDRVLDVLVPGIRSRAAARRRLPERGCPSAFMQAISEGPKSTHYNNVVMPPGGAFRLAGWGITVSSEHPSQPVGLTHLASRSRLEP